MSEENPRSSQMAQAVELFRSRRRADCDDRAFVLSAVGIPNAVISDGTQFLLMVDADSAGAALEQLELYETESRAAPIPPPPMPVHPYAWVGCVTYATVLIAVALMISNGLWRLDAFDVGELDAGRVQSGQWWRAWTALTLHVNGAHLWANVAGGIWFGFLAARQIGTGSTWLLIVIGAGIANLLEALFSPSTHRSVGASTAVFTALGLLAAHTWRMRFRLPQRWASRWGPLVGGVALLSWTGTGTEGTDVVAHLAGFAVGILFGAVVAQQSVARTLNRLPQWGAGTLALSCIVICWVCALAS